MAQVARARYRLWISWQAYNLGLLTFDSSLFDGTDVFAVSPLDASFGGTYDDVSARLRRATWSRGRNNNRDTMLAGNATLDLRDPAGIFNPDNPAGPLYGQLEDRLHPVKLVAERGGITYPQFYGWTRRFAWEPEGRRGVTRVECVDLFYWLKRVKPVIANPGVTTTGACIGLVLDAAGLTDPALRDLDAGDTIPGFTEADGTKDGIQLIADLLEAERGVFFAAGNGAATYRSRTSRLTMDSIGTINDRMTALAPGVDFESAFTRVTVKRTQNAYIAVATSDDVTIQRLGYVDLPLIETAYLSSDAQANDLAASILAQVDTPRPPIYGYQLDNRESDLLTHVLARELVDRFTTSEAVGGTAGDFHIDRMQHTLERRRHTVNWLLSRAGAADALQFDKSLFDSSDIFVY